MTLWSQGRPIASTLPWRGPFDPEEAEALPPPLSRVESLWTLLPLFFLYTGLGAYLFLIRHLQPLDALARLSSAYLVFFGHERKLATIGFVWPPLPTLALLPLAWIPPLVFSGLAVVLVSASAMAVAAWLLSQILAILRLPDRWRRIWVFLFATNPLILLFAVNGYSEALLLAILLAGLLWWIRFGLTDRNAALLLAGLFLGFLPMVRYEAALVSGALSLVLAGHLWSQRHRFSNPTEFRHFAEGRLLAFLSILIYPTFLWVFFSGLIMKNPFYFLTTEQSALQVADFQLAGRPLSGNPLFSGILAFGLWAAVFPALLLLLPVALFQVRRRARSFFWGGLLLTPWVVPLFQALLLSQRSVVPLIRYYILAVPFGILTAALLLYLGPVNGRRRRSFLGGLTLLLLLSNLSTGLLLHYGTRFQTVERQTWRALVLGQDGRHTTLDKAFRMGQELRAFLPPDARVLMDEYGGGFAILLGARTARPFWDHTHPLYSKALLDPPFYVDYILVPAPRGSGALNAVNRYYPRLYDGELPWAQPVEGPLGSGDGWRLFRIVR